jgi:hypothetical protein
VEMVGVVEGLVLTLEAANIIKIRLNTAVKTLNRERMPELPHPEEICIWMMVVATNFTMAMV